MRGLIGSTLSGWNYGKSQADKIKNKLDMVQHNVQISDLENSLYAANEHGRGIEEYSYIEMEALVNDRSVSVPTVVAGGSVATRAQMLSVLIWEAQSQGLPVLVLHGDDRELEKAIQLYFSNICLVNQQHPFYDPFNGMNNAQIADAIMYSAPKDSLNDDARFFLEGINAFIKSKQKSPSAAILADAPVLDMYDKVTNAVANGALSAQNAQPILNHLVQGQGQAAALAGYFSRLRMHGQGLMNLSFKIPHAVNLQMAIQSRGILSLNIGPVQNTIVQDLILYELLQVISTGRDMLLILDGVQIVLNEKWKQLLLSAPGNVIPVWAGNDIFSILGSAEDVFHSVIGHMSRYFLLKQPNAVTAAKWSDILGQYERQIMDRSYSTGTNGVGNNVSVSRSQEYRVPPQTLMSMSAQAAYCYDATSSSLIHTENFIVPHYD